MKHLDLFSGIGGFALAAQWVWGEDHNIYSFVEIDPFCQKVLKKHWPGVPIISNIKEYKHDGTKIDLLTGGFPCQPFSVAGKQRGTEDDRYLWPEMLRVVSEVHPTWIIGENVAGIINMGLDQVLSDLENEGYSCQPFIIPACAKNAPHRRDRVWIVANARCSNGKTCNSNGMGNEKQGLILQTALSNSHASNSQNKRLEGRDRKGPSRSGGRNTKYIISDKRENENEPWNEQWLKIATRLCRMDDGVSSRVDRLKSLGNAIVPQVVTPIMQAIKDVLANEHI